MNDLRYCELINELVSETCNCQYCFLKMFIEEAVHSSPRNLIQIKCIEKFKFETSKGVGYDIGWNQAGILWVTDGWAKAFADVFNEELSFKDTYEKIRALVTSSKPT